MSDLILKPGREKPILNGHPWVYSGGVRQINGNPQAGDILTVRAHDGFLLGKAYWNPQSQIQARMLTWADETIDEAWWRRSLARSVAARRDTLSRDAYRLVNAENDFIPGLIVDCYGEFLVLQALTLGIDRRKHLIADILATLVDVRGIYERSDADVREKEGLPVKNGVIWGQEPPEYLVITEFDRQLYVDIYNGHKTGHYLDQMTNRRLLRDLLTRWPDAPPSVLNLFSYTGSFGLHALDHAGPILNVDSSFDALKLAEANVILNGYPTDRAEYIQADVFEYLRDMADVGSQHDIVILDPPKFAHSKSQVNRASRGYKDINLHAFYVVKPGGYLMTFSCSGAISAALFQKIVFGALADSGRHAQIVQRLGPATDHPVALTFPEGDYLKGLLLRVF
jgi:23S rRNA (cytosine1962-C5)-methyltransferase